MNETIKCQARRDTEKKEASTERGRGLLVCFPRLCIRKVVFFTPWPPHSPFLGKSETKPREAAAGRERRTGKLALGRREGGREGGREVGGQVQWSPHSMSDRERSRSFWDGSLEHTHRQTDTKRETHMHAYISSCSAALLPTLAFWKMRPESFL